MRQSNCERSYSGQFNMLRAIENKFIQQPDEFGIQWSKLFKNGQEKGVPSPNEVMRPIENFFINKVLMKMDPDNPMKDVIVEQYREVFLKIVELFITDQEPDAPCMRFYHPNTHTGWMILWLLSIEPGFYNELNTAIGEFLESSIETFGPIARGLHDITKHAESHRTDGVMKDVPKEIMDQELGIF